MNRFFTILIFFFCLSVHPQDFYKVKVIGDVLCDCLRENADKQDVVRIDQCGYVLSKGLSALKNDSIQGVYASKSDTYLQKNCFEYISLISKQKTNSDLKVSNKQSYESKDNFFKYFQDFEDNNFYYKDFIDDSIVVTVNESRWREKLTSSGNMVSFNLIMNENSTKLRFVESNDSFFNDYYKPDEIIEVRAKKNTSNVIVVVFKFSNGIVMEKQLTKI
ncbi:hypothetical protein [Aquimarina intermedia]|uniref:Uncharacterized protein n=1 Tax=Aquimarina intermedia TaxID=350814 RepID=A0A5S5CBW8_9FLAO|nr:hypothetical protein [Aquimarina intermedia]TYP76138.1 hypothetical protein BD809_102355 [Aquimarina intermedia]